MVEYRAYLEEIFADADQLMWQLSAETGRFTFYTFLRHAYQRHQGAYVRMLHAVLESRGEAYLFNIAHENIGRHLSVAAERAGYEKIRHGAMDVDIWGNPQPATVYQRTDHVMEPMWQA